MAALLNVAWSDEAKQNLSDILKYFEARWTINEEESFIKKLDKCIFLIASKPKLFPLTKHKQNLRRCVFSKQTSIYYSETNSVIYIVSLFDNRSDPSKL